MAAGIIKVNGKKLFRKNIAFWTIVDSTKISITTVDGTLHERDYNDAGKAEEADGIITNLTEVDDLDGI